MHVYHVCVCMALYTLQPREKDSIEISTIPLHTHWHATNFGLVIVLTHSVVLYTCTQGKDGNIMQSIYTIYVIIQQQYGTCTYIVISLIPPCSIYICTVPSVLTLSKAGGEMSKEQDCTSTLGDHYDLSLQQYSISE